MTHRRLTVSCLSLLLLTAGITLLPACSSQSTQQGQAQGPQELPVRTLSASDFSANNSYPAVIRGEDDAEIRPKVSGFITKVYVTEGQSVKAGQPLFHLDDVTYRAAVSQATASLSAAQASLATAQLNQRNSQDLLAKNIISQSNYEEVSNALKSAEANVAVAKAALVSARENLSYCTVTSPVSGVIGSINYRVGNLVSPQSASALTQVSNTRQAYVYFSVSEREMQTLAGMARPPRAFPRCVCASPTAANTPKRARSRASVASSTRPRALSRCVSTSPTLRASSVAAR